MKRKLISLASLLLTALLLLSSCSGEAKNSEITYVKGAGSEARAYYLRERELGSCSTLTGAVHFTAVFVSDASSSWQGVDLTAATASLQRALDAIGAEAEKYSAELTLTLGSVACSITASAPAEPNYYGWLEQALEAAGLGSASDAAERLKAEHSADSVPIIFLFNREGRAYSSVGADSQLEYCVAYTAEEDSLIHEILHSFGARDLYYPAEVATLASDTLGESFMNRGVGVDPLTAYLIGWEQELPRQAERFLDSLTLTERDIEKALAAETYTGFASREFAEGKYTGELVFGVADGRGKMTYNEGHVYDGDWKENRPHGTGSMTWAHGDVYMGEWKKGKRDGTGTYVWADGTEYVGGWRNDKMHGNGVITYPDGRVVSGTWHDGSLA